MENYPHIDNIFALFGFFRSLKLGRVGPYLYLAGRLQWEIQAPSRWCVRKRSWWEEGQMAQMCGATLLSIYPRVTSVTISQYGLNESPSLDSESAVGDMCHMKALCKYPFFPGTVTTFDV